MTSRRSSLSQQAHEAELSAAEFTAVAERIAADRQARLENAPLQTPAHSSSKLERLRALKQRRSRSSFGETRGACQTALVAESSPAPSALDEKNTNAAISSTHVIVSAMVPAEAAGKIETMTPDHSDAGADRAALLQRALRAEEDNARLRQLLGESSTNAAALTPIAVSGAERARARAELQPQIPVTATAQTHTSDTVVTGFGVKGGSTTAHGHEPAVARDSSAAAALYMQVEQLRRERDTARSQLELAQAELLARTQSMDKEVRYLQAEVQRLAGEQQCRTDVRTNARAAVPSGMEIADLQDKSRKAASVSSGKAQLQHFKYFLARSATNSSSTRGE